MGIPTMSHKELTIEAKEEGGGSDHVSGELLLIKTEIAEARAMNPGASHIPI